MRKGLQPNNTPCAKCGNGEICVCRSLLPEYFNARSLFTLLSIYFPARIMCRKKEYKASSLSSSVALLLSPLRGWQFSLGDPCPHNSSSEVAATAAAATTTFSSHPPLRGIFLREREEEAEALKFHFAQGNGEGRDTPSQGEEEGIPSSLPPLLLRFP